MTNIPSIAPYPLPTSVNLPANIARWAVDPQRAVLLIHDMQRYFLRAFEPGMRGQLIANIALLRTRCVEAGIPVAYSAQPGGMTQEQRGLLNDFWGPGMKVDPEDRNVIDELSPSPDDWILMKWRYSAFFRSDLLERMRATGRDQLIITGIYAHVGILATSVDAFTNDIQPFLVADAIGDFSNEFHNLTLEYAAQRCAFVTTLEEIFR